MAGSVKKAETSDYRLRNQLFIAALVAAVLGPFPVHGSRIVAAVESAWEEFREVTLAEVQRWKCAFSKRSSLSPGEMQCHHLFRQLNSELILLSAWTMKCLCLH